MTNSTPFIIIGIIFLIIILLPLFLISSVAFSACSIGESIFNGISGIFDNIHIGSVFCSLC